MKAPSEEVQRQVREWLAYADDDHRFARAGFLLAAAENGNRVRAWHRFVGIHPDRGKPSWESSPATSDLAILAQTKIPTALGLPVLDHEIARRIPTRACVVGPPGARPTHPIAATGPSSLCTPGQHL